MAFIALVHMSEMTKQEVVNLLGSEQDFIDAGSWADQVRLLQQNTAPCHYVNIPYGTGAYDPAKFCKDDDCVIARISSFTRIVADRQLITAVRVEALKWLIHLMGDIHQPLHCANDEDRGGNEVWVRISGKTNKLHSWWNTGLVDGLGINASEISDRIMKNIGDLDMQNWSRGTPEQWAMESFGIAHNFIYTRSRGKNTKSTPIILPSSYVGEAAPVINRQIARAGIRLAWTLNRALQ